MSMKIEIKLEKVFVIFLIFLLGYLIWPENIVATTGWKTIILADILFTGIYGVLGLMLVELLIFLFYKLEPYRYSFIIIYTLWAVIIFLSLYFTSKSLKSFEINGVFTYIVLTLVILVLFSKSEKHEN